MAGRVDQSPVFYWRRDWGGSSRQIGQMPEPVGVLRDRVTPMLIIDDEIRAVLRPLMGDKDSRRAKLGRAFRNYPEIRDRISVDGDTSVFLELLIDTLRDYGEVEEGKPAMCVLMESIKSEVGLKDRERVERIVRDYPR